MTSNIPHASAMIIPFPKNRRTAVARREEIKPAVEQPVSDAACGNWYHEEAIQESNWILKH